MVSASIEEMVNLFLEKMLLLNQVEMAFCVDVNIEPSSPTEFGGILVLDDFGIELGGGDSDGGNGMAKGLLSGGEDGKDAVKPIFDIAVSKVQWLRYGCLNTWRHRVLVPYQ